MYDNAFRLREPAFNLTPDPRFFFANSSHQEAYATLCYGIEHRKGIIVITGEAGTGKTTLLRMFIHNAASTIHSSCILDPHLNFVELLRCTLDAFGLAPSSQDRVSMLGQLHGYLVEQLKRGHIVAILLDEAQDLSDEVLEELRLLSNLEDAGEELVQIVLLGHTEFDSRLDGVSLCQFKQRIALRSRLQPLRSEDIRPYIDCRLSAAGYSGNALFATSAIDRIALYSKGIPRLVNLICDNALLIACVTSQNNVGPETIEEVAGELKLNDPGDFTAGPIPAFASRSVPPEDLAGDNLKSGGLGDRAEPRWVIDGANRSASSAGVYAESDKTNSWNRRSAVCVIVVVILAGATTHYFWQWQETDVKLPQVTDHIEEVFKPIRELVDRVLMTHEPTEKATKVGSNAESSRSGEKPFPSSKFHQRFNPLPTNRKDAPKKFQGNEYPKETKSNERRADPKPDQRFSGQVQVGEEKTPPLSRRSIQVVFENSIVRDKPASNAEIIATLRPGARVRLVGRKGDYWQIHSGDPEIIRGYVHREDAFFEPLK
jgi:general secretion pathway protein A